MGEMVVNDDANKTLETMTENDFPLLKECITMTETGGLTVSLKRLGLVNHLELNDYTSTDVTNTLGIANGFIRLKIKFNTKRDFGLKQAYGIYNQFVRENTEDVLNNKEEGLAMIVELGKVVEKKNLYYRIQLFNPILCFAENDEYLHLVFTMDSMTFGKMDVSYENVLNDLEVNGL